MKVQRFSRTKAVGQSSVIALVTAALTFAAISFVINATQSPSFSLTASSNFAITSTISSSSSTQTPALLDPGAPRYLWYTVHNSLHVPITVTALSVPAVNGPAGCPASNLDVSNTTFTGSLVVPAKVGSVAGTNTVAKPISLSSAAPDSCKSVTFGLTFAGSATYVEVYGTSTAVSSSQNPSTVGQPVTYTATVTGNVGSGQDPLPSGPSGTVTFKEGATTICANVPVTVGATTSTAQCTPAPAYSTPTSHTITATYTNTDGNFTGSNGSLTQVVNLPTGCSGTYNSIVGNPASPTVNGTNGNDFIYAVGANYKINGGQGNDCIVVGDGNNTITDGNGDDVIVAGNGTNTVTSGNGNNRITVGNGSGNKVTAGNGSNTVFLGTGANNTVTLGNGGNTITIQTPGNHDTITVGNGKNTAYLGGGTFNKFTGGKKNNNTCHLPSLPASTYNDTLGNCTAVTP
jgi:Ca2+-binding RTX toxin-like protein